MWITLKTAQDMYDPRIKLGTFVSALLPIGLVLMAAWIVFLFIWMLLVIPVGPGVNTYMPQDEKHSNYLSKCPIPWTEILKITAIL